MIEQIKTPKGMPDILPEDQIYWEKVYQVGRKIAKLYDFSYIEPPVLEFAKLFELSLEKSSEIVEKQMFVFKTKGGKRLALRPEITASIVRAYLQHHLGHHTNPVRAFYYGPVFRYERPQLGRYRQFRQLGYEILGEKSFLWDAQVILIALNYLNQLKLSNLKLEINTIGCRDCRADYRKALVKYYRRHRKELCPTCQKNLERNPLRILDCKQESCQSLKYSAPSIFDYLCSECSKHFKGVLESLEEDKLEYILNPFLVRGLDYYNRTVFEISTEGYSPALAGGGRYDYLGKILGSKKEVPAVGVAIGLERVIEALKSAGVKFKSKSPQLFVATVGKKAQRASLALMEEIRQAGIAVIDGLEKKSLRAQLEKANKRNVPWTIIIGQKEVYEQTVIIRDMNSGIQEVVPRNKLIQELRKRIK